ncbi:hypothetical protein [Micromonospora sp. KC721]|uniref:hypothetical protein n=1 Tax=Micromonospora sp. KC721 TaxID=2530380 RepID=UPI00104FE090|nr:hypothetical protein [Micromonospora sp. KC721]TDB80154.1 hypothetical protein E1182_09940 [Micromonospora sp. KC721]
MAEQSVKAVRAETEKAALQLLRERTNLVGEAATARHERDQLAEALRQASTRYAERYQAALQGGWTAADLARLGLDAPELESSKRRRSSRSTPPTPPAAHQPDEPVDVGVDTGTQE